MKDIFCVDPMSYNNLEVYDYELLTHISSYNIHFFGNVKLKKKIKNSHLIYKYSDKKKINKVLSYIKSQCFLLKQIYTIKPEIIHFQWFRLPVFDFLVIIIIKKSKLKIIHTAHNKLPHDTGLKYFYIYKKIYHAVDRIIVHSENTKKELIKEFGIHEYKIAVIPHGILELNNTEEISIDIKNNINANKIVVSFLGNISLYKGIDQLVRCWKTFTVENRHLQLIIAGSGVLPDKSIMESFEDTIVDIRFLSDREFYTYLKFSDIILLPYREISQSGVLLTALSEKKCILTTDKGGLGDPYRLVGLGELLSNSNIAESLLNIFKKLNKEPQYIDKMKIDEKSWAILRDYYSWTNIGLKTESLYKSVIDE